MHQEKVQQEKLKTVKARLNFEEISQHSESGTPSRRRDLRKRLGSRRDKEKSMSAHSNDSRRQSYHNSRRDTESCYQSSRSRGTELASEKHHNKRASSRRTEALLENEGSAGGHWKSGSKKQRSSIKDDDLSQPCVCEETDPFTPRIRYFNLPKRTRMPSHVKTYDGRGVAAGNQERKKSLPPWKQQEAGHKQNFKKEVLKISTGQSEDRTDLLFSQNLQKRFQPWKKENLKLHLQ
ncbi:hypothetical protein Tco_1472203 [Tanacetum coccineum]